MSTSDPFTATAIVKHLSYLGAFFLGLSMESFVILAAFMVLDTFLGVVRVGVVHGPTAIKSYRLISGLLSKLTIILIPLVVAYTGKGVGLDLHHVASGALSILILSHAYSIFGNIHSIRLRKDVYEFDAISWLLTRLQTMIERLIKHGAPDKTPMPETSRELSTKPKDL